MTMRRVLGVGVALVGGLVLVLAVAGVTDGDRAAVPFGLLGLVLLAAGLSNALAPAPAPVPAPASAPPRRVRRHHGYDPALACPGTDAGVGWPGTGDDRSGRPDHGWSAGSPDGGSSGGSSDGSPGSGSSGAGSDGGSSGGGWSDGGGFSGGGDGGSGGGSF